MRQNSIRIFIVLLATIAVTGSLCAAQPRITLIDPPGMRRGGELDLLISGERLSDAQALLFYSPGISVTNLEPAEGNRVKAKVAVAPDCRQGLHVLRLRTSTGVSNLWTVSVGALPEAAEVEPNSQFDTPQEISLDVTVNGVVTKEDVDYYAIDAKKGQRLTAELEGIRLGISFFDPYVAILNTDRFALASSDDAALLRQDALCSIIVPEDGRYIIQVRDSAFEGSDRCKYRLHVGQFPRPRAILPAGGAAGTPIEGTWIGDVAGPKPAKLTLPPAEQLAKLPTQQASLTPQDESGLAPSPVHIRISDLPNALEAEPNNARDQATPFTVPGAANGVIGERGDVDHFRFSATKGQQLDVRVYARQVLRSPLDSVLRIRDASGKNLVSNDDSTSPDSYVRFSVPADGDYIIELHDQLRDGGVDYVYRVEVAPVQPRLTTRLPERERYFSTTLAVPKGNRMALLVGVRRADWGGAAHLEFPDLPAGVTAQAVPMPANRDLVPVLFSAAADAQLAGALVHVVGRPAENKPPIEGHLAQRTMLIRGQNNRDVWGHVSDRMAAVVTEAIPFRVEIAAPKAPLVRNGSMNLKIVAHRNEGFTAPIAISMLYNPPGVSSRGTVTIPEGQNEAVIPLTANGSAEIRRWPIVVIGRGPGANGGSVEASSQLVDLDVSDRYFDLAFDKAAVEQGQAASLAVKITPKRKFEGAAKVEVLGLPKGATCPPLEFVADATELILPIQTAKDAQVGRHGTVMCRIVLTEQGEPVTHTLGTGELRIDRPLPPKNATAEAKPKPEPKPEPAKPQPKTLSRLEQLRQQRQAAQQK